ATARPTPSRSAAEAKLRLPPQRVGGAARVGARFQRAAFLVDEDGADRTGQPREVRPPFDLMAATGKVAGNLVREPPFEIETARIVVVRRERRGIRITGEARLLDR